MSKVSASNGAGKQRRTLGDKYMWEPRAIMSYLKTIGPYGYTVYGYLKSRVLSKNKAGQNAPLEEIAVKHRVIKNATGISISQIKRSLAKLCQEGIIDVLEPTKRGEACTYVLLRFGPKVKAKSSAEGSAAQFDVARTQLGSSVRTPVEGSGGAPLEGSGRAEGEGSDRATLSTLSVFKTQEAQKQEEALETSRGPLSSVPLRGTIPTPAKNAGAAAQVPFSHPETDPLPSEKPQPGEVERVRKDLENRFSTRGGYTTSFIEDLRRQAVGHPKAAVLEQALLAIEAVYGPPRQYVN
jgi:hypothetical protein